MKLDWQNSTLFANAGAMARYYAETDWASSPVGPPDAWSPVLSTTIGTMLECQFPMFLLWGSELSLLYNEACTGVMGSRHPAGLGKSLQDVAPEAMTQLGPIIEAAREGRPVKHSNMPFSLRRHGYDEATWFTISYSAVRNPDRSVAGVLCTCIETTEQVRAEQALTEEIRRLHEMFEQAPSPMALLMGPDHCYVISNAANQQLLNYRTVIGQTVREALPELVEQGIVSLLDNVYQTGEPFIGHELPIMVQQSDGGLAQYYVNFIYQPIRNVNSKVIGIFMQAHDATDYVRTSAALRESEQQLRQLANTIPQLAWMADKDGHISWFNDRWFDYTGKDLDSMQGWGWQEVHDSEVLPEVLAAWNHSLTTQTPFEMTFPLRGKDGRFRQFYTLTAPLRNSTGEVVRWFGTNTDVSSLHDTQQALEQTEEWLQAGLLSARMVAWEWNAGTNSIKYSANAREVLGYDADHTEVGFATIHPDELERLKNAIARAWEERTYFREVTRRIRPDNQRTIWIDTRGEPVFGAAGEPLYLRGVSIDVTDRVVAENELKEASQRKDEFLAMLAHELRNPLAPIAMAANLLGLPALPASSIAYASTVITRQVAHMTRLVDDLLDVSRIKRGLVNLTMEQVEMKDVVHAAVEQVRPLIESRSHRLALQMNERPMLVRGDRTRLIQVISNLLNNAARYSPDGGNIQLEVTATASAVQLRVQDRGDGIDPQFLPFVFDLFTQGKRAPDRAQGGLGIGLALVSNILALHGGSVKAESPGIGLGSSFSVHLPAAVAAAATPSSLISNANCDVPSRRILIVDDNLDAADMLCVWLQTQGHRVEVHESAHAALLSLATFVPEVCIFDIGLPGMNGYELVTALRRHPEAAGAFCIALTGYGQDADRLRSVSAGFDQHLVKPVDLEQLARLLQPVPA